jgi:hypothetical protein
LQEPAAPELAPSGPKTYRAKGNQGPLAIGSNLAPDQQFAALAVLVGSKQVNYDAKANRYITFEDQEYTADLSKFTPEQIAELDKVGRQIVTREAKIDAQRAAVARAQQLTETVQQTAAPVADTSSRPLISNEEVSSRYFANGTGRFSTYQAEQERNAQMIAVALGGGMGVPTDIPDPFVSSGLSNPVTGAIAGFVADATQATVRVGTAVKDNPKEAVVGMAKKVINFGPEMFNLGVQATKLVAQGYVEIAGATGLVSQETVQNVRDVKPLQIEPLAKYENDAQLGGSIIADLALGYGMAKYGSYGVRLRSAAPGTLYSNPLPFELVPPGSTGAAGASAAAEAAVNGRASLDPATISFTQSSVSFQKAGRGYNLDTMVESMRTRGWVGDPIDVVRMPDGTLATIDNTRVLAARQAGINVEANVRGFDEPITDAVRRASLASRGSVPATWGEAARLRITKPAQNATYPNMSPPWSERFPYGSLYDPKVK